MIRYLNYTANLTDHSAYVDGFFCRYKSETNGLLWSFEAPKH